jgi:hypothetical protein
VLIWHCGDAGCRVVEALVLAGRCAVWCWFERDSNGLPVAWSGGCECGDDRAQCEHIDAAIAAAHAEATA